MGFEVVGTWAEDMDNPKKDIPKALIIGGLIILVLLYILLFKNLLRKKNLKNRVCKSLYKYSNYNDYLLLNDYRIHIDDKNIGHIDHILITNKFITIINDFPLSGVITGDYNDENLNLI